MVPAKSQLIHVAITLIVLVPAWLAGSGSMVVAQTATREDFDKSLIEWKATYAELLQVYMEFETCEESEAEEWKNQYRELKLRGDEQAGHTIDLAAEVYESSPNGDAVLRELLTNLPSRYYVAGKYEKSTRIGQALLKHDPENSEVMFNTLKSAFVSNNFSYARELFEEWNRQHGSYPENLESFREYLDTLEAGWNEELRIREQEIASDQLPRIQFETNQGTIVVELFEEQAPVVVNNLIHLVENGDFFRNMTFFQVLPHQYARTGCARNDGTAGLRIGTANAENRSNARGHFRGAVSLEINEQDGAVLTHCYFIRIPMPQLDGVNLVVGRVVEGMDVVDRISATHELNEELVPEPIVEAQPDRLIGAKVIRKADKEYNFIQN